jgi:hypothetical protein
MRKKRLNWVNSNNKEETESVAASSLSVPKLHAMLILLRKAWRSRGARRHAPKGTQYTHPSIVRLLIIFISIFFAFSFSMFFHELIGPLFEQVSYIMSVQMLVAIPLMRHGTESTIPIVHLERLFVIKPPIRKGFGP